MTEEFGSETDVNQVRKQNQQSEANKKMLLDSARIRSKTVRNK